MRETDPSARVLHRLMRRLAARHARREADGHPRPHALRVAASKSRNDRNLLRRIAPEDPHARIVLRDLDACETDHLCLSGACAVCNTLLQRVATPLIDDLIGSADSWYCATIIRSSPIIPCGRLAGRCLFDEFEEDLHEFFAIFGAAAIGCLEISNNEHHADLYAPCFVEHIHFFTTLRVTRAIRRRLRELFPATRVVKRPIKVSRFDGDRAAIRYALKPDLSRRIEIDRIRPDGSRSSYSTRKKPMRSAERIEVAQAMHRFAPVRRLFLHDIELVTTRARARFVLTDSDT